MHIVNKDDEEGKKTEFFEGKGVVETSEQHR